MAILKTDKPARWKWVALVAAVIVAGTLAFAALDRTPPLAGMAPVTLSPLALPIAQPASVYEPSATRSTPVLSSLGLAKSAPESKAQAFDRLAASTDHRQRFEGYKLVERCVTAHMLSEPARTPWFGKNRQALPFDQDACGDLKPGQWDNPEGRIALLRESTLKGEHGAWARLRGNEGPQGMYKTIPDGPEYVEWEKRAYAAALKSGDPYALAKESQEYRRKDPAKALELVVAYRESLAHNRGMPFDPSTDEEVKALAATLDPTIAAKQIAAGRAYAANRSKS